ncbi:MAG TPA: hypothetical protein VIT20_09210 [Propionibacteriaceae bacterium]
MDTLKRFREPLVMVVLVILGLRVPLALVTAGAYAAEDSSDGISGIAALVAYRAGDPALVVLLTALIASCVLVDPTPRARGLSLAALIVVGVSVLVGLVFGSLTFLQASSIWLANAVDVLVGLAAPVVCMFLLFRFHVLGRDSAARANPYALPATPTVPQLETPRYEPTWQPDVAAGASWQTAGDAAAGAPASAWGTPGQQGGWQPQPPAQPPTDQPRSDQGRWSPGQPPPN